jgi:hypothetical protein
MPIYAATIFVGAFLLFLVQHLIGKFILPWFGGGPGVWTVCILFFQVLLLGGYAYAHAISRWLTPRRQALLHGALLAVALLSLPIAPDAVWKPASDDAPTWRILQLLVVSLGLPYFVLSATGPLMQRWFSLSNPGVSPYRLYALSNAGSLLALVAYPFAVEPLLARVTQSTVWSGGMVVFAALCGACAWQISHLPAHADAAATRTGASDGDAPTSRSSVFYWVALPAIASVLLVAVTNKLSTDVAVTPFIWVLPLGLYLATLIICFDHTRWYDRRAFTAIFAVGCATVWFLLDQGSKVRLPVQVIGYAGTLFAACMICHGELYLMRPAPRLLTRFYLCIAAGGALGGVAVALVAPLIFSTYHELSIGLWVLATLAGVLCLKYKSRDIAVGAAAGAAVVPLLLPLLMTRRIAGGPAWWTQIFGHVREFSGDHWQAIVAVVIVLWWSLGNSARADGRPWRMRFAAAPLALSVLLGLTFLFQARAARTDVVEMTRSFYGTLLLREGDPDDPRNRHYMLTHGITTHGVQFAAAPLSFQPTAYYGRTSGVGRIIDAIPAGSSRHIGMVGLGAGTIAAYGRSRDRVRIYEINHDVIRIAHDYFTYLDQSLAAIQIVPGDARLTMEDELRRGERQGFDVLALDAFNSDAIPVHLLTREAFAIYLEHLQPSGVIAVHVSNRHLRLGPVIEGLAQHYGLHQAVVFDNREKNPEWWNYSSLWVLLTRDGKMLQSDAIRQHTERPVANPGVVVWTDDHASVLSILR